MTQSTAARALCGLCFVALLVHAARADDEEIPLNKLPAAVTKSVKAKFPKAKMVGASKQKEGDAFVYQVSLEQGKESLHVIVEENGDIVEIDKEIPVEDLPKVVLSAVKAKFPKNEILGAEEITDEEKVVTYAVVLFVSEKKLLHVTLDAKGKVLSEEKIDAPK